VLRLAFDAPHEGDESSVVPLAGKVGFGDVDPLGSDVVVRRGVGISDELRILAW
jgi:hypothetical protein